MMSNQYKGEISMSTAKKLLEKLNKAIKENTPISDVPSVIIKQLEIDGFSGLYKAKEKSIEFEVATDAEKALKSLQNSMDKYPLAKDLKVKDKTLYFEPVLAESVEDEDKGYLEFDKALELSGMDKIEYCHKLVGRNVKFKDPSAYGTVGKVINYDKEFDKIIVKVGAEKLVTVSSKDIEVVGSVKEKTDESLSTIEDVKKTAILDYLTNSYYEDTYSEAKEYLQSEFNLSDEDLGSILDNYENLPVVSRDKMKTEELMKEVFKSSNVKEAVEQGYKWVIDDIARVKEEGSSAGIEAYRGQDGTVVDIDDEYIWVKMKDGKTQPFTKEELE